MSISVNERQAYSEIDEFLELLDDEHKRKVPGKLREFFKNEKDNNYRKNINPNAPIKEQNLREETLGIIALLNLQYWCKDEAEKQRLMDKYSDNERKYQEKLREKYNPDNLFQRRNTIPTQLETNISTDIIEHKKANIFSRIINKIKTLFSSR